MMDDFAKSKDNTTRLMMTEAYATIPQQVLWYGNEDGSKLGGHIPFNFLLITELDMASNAAKFKTAIDTWMEAMPNYGNANWVLGNHDRNRVATRYGTDRAESLAIMTMMLPGINVIYNGEEIRMINNPDITWEQTEDPQACATNISVFRKISRDPVRTPFQWDDTTSAGFSKNTNTFLPVHKDYKTNNLKMQKEAEKSTFKLYQSLIKLRKESHTLMHGGLVTKAVNDKVFGFYRTLKDHNSVAVLVNLGDEVKVSLKDLMDKDDWSDDIKGKLLIVSNDSKLKVGDDVSPEDITLSKYDAIVIEVSSASKLAISALLIFVGLIKYFF
jgi:alpha-glucosidase